ncbi:MAG: DUF4185 domain-containing protein [Gemmatimonadetes bacterium]|jgi:hypothetical protein|nr:DUF4185 domain-containing protein [Gemmatimonadota bacterium]
MSQHELPYPQSDTIKDIEFDWQTHQREGEGSDNWQCTWADDDHLYCAFGDGGGFGGSNSLGRVSLGYSRIEGNHDDYTGTNVWGGHEAENRAQFAGKSWGTLCVDGVLYSWVSPDYSAWGWYPGHASECRLFYSNNHGAKWSPAKWLFFKEDNLMIPTMLQHGKDYADAPDSYVYHYFMKPFESKTFGCPNPGRIYLARVPKDSLLDRQAYQFLSNIQNGNAQWNSDVQAKIPVFEDHVLGVGWNCSVSYNPGIKRYILMTEHLHTSRGNFGMFEGETPWGPWKTVQYLNHENGDHFGAAKNLEMTCFYWSIPTKWISKNGREFTMVFTGINSKGNDAPVEDKSSDGNDSWNTVRCKLVM